MKSILYAGATFMLAAGVYGFTELKNEKIQSTFNSLYTGPSKAPKNPIVPELVSVPFDEEGNPVFIEEVGAKREKKSKKKADINYKLFSRASLIEEVEVTPLPEIKVDKKN